MTRAQEAEENYLVKRELATIKQQSEEASAQLEQAKKTISQLQQQQQPQAVRRATVAGCTGSDPVSDRETGIFPRSVRDVTCLKPQGDHFKIIWSSATHCSVSNDMF